MPSASVPDESSFGFSLFSDPLRPDLGRTFFRAAPPTLPTNCASSKSDLNARCRGMFRRVTCSGLRIGSTGTPLQSPQSSVGNLRPHPPAAYWLRHRAVGPCEGRRWDGGRGRCGNGRRPRRRRRPCAGLASRALHAARPRPKSMRRDGAMRRVGQNLKNAGAPPRSMISVDQPTPDQCRVHNGSATWLEANAQISPDTSGGHASTRASASRPLINRERSHGWASQ